MQKLVYYLTWNSLVHFSSQFYSNKKQVATKPSAIRAYRKCLFSLQKACKSMSNFRSKNTELIQELYTCNNQCFKKRKLKKLSRWCTNQSCWVLMLRIELGWQVSFQKLRRHQKRLTECTLRRANWDRPLGESAAFSLRVPLSTQNRWRLEAPMVTWSMRPSYHLVLWSRELFFVNLNSNISSRRPA